MQFAERSAAGIAVLFALLSGPVHGQGSTRIFALTHDDYVRPTFSPSGRWIAVSQVISDSNSESTQVLRIDVQRRKVDTLFTAAQAVKYAVYKAYVFGLRWDGDSLLAIDISDGDVGGTTVTIDTRDLRIVSEVGDEGLEAVDPVTEALADSLGTLYPNEAPPRGEASSVFESAFESSRVQLPGAILLQKRYSGVEHHIWVYRTDRKEATRILTIAPGESTFLVGGVPILGGAIFAVSGEMIQILRLKDGKLDTLATTAPQSAVSTITTVATRGEDIWFLLHVYESYEEGNNLAYHYDGSRLRVIGTYSTLADFDVDPTGHRAVFAYWVGKNRHLAIHRLPAQ